LSLGNLKKISRSSEKDGGYNKNPIGGLGATYDDGLKLIGKRKDFLLVLIELFSLCVMAEALRAEIDRQSAISVQRGQFDPKFQVQGTSPTNHFCTDS